MNSQQLTNVASIVVIATGASGLVAWGAARAWRGIKRLARFLDDYEGTPARSGVDARPGVMQRLQTIEAAQRDDARLVAIEGKLQALSDELPKNGVPAALKLDALYQALIAQRLPLTPPTPHLPGGDSL